MLEKKYRDALHYLCLRVESLWRFLVDATEVITVFMKWEIGCWMAIAVMFTYGLGMSQIRRDLRLESIERQEQASAIAVLKTVQGQQERHLEALDVKMDAMIAAFADNKIEVAKLAESTEWTNRIIGAILFTLLTSFVHTLYNKVLERRKYGRNRSGD